MVLIFALDLSLSLLESIFDGSVICVNDEHPEKASLPIEVPEDGIVICVNDEHSAKAHFPIEVI